MVWPALLFDEETLLLFLLPVASLCEVRPLREVTLALARAARVAEEVSTTCSLRVAGAVCSGVVVVVFARDVLVPLSRVAPVERVALVPVEVLVLEFVLVLLPVLRRTCDEELVPAERLVLFELPFERVAVVPVLALLELVLVPVLRRTCDEELVPELREAEVPLDVVVVLRRAWVLFVVAAEDFCSEVLLFERLAVEPLVEEVPLERVAVELLVLVVPEVLVLRRA